MIRSSLTASRSLLLPLAPRFWRWPAGLGSVPLSMPLGLSVGRPFRPSKGRNFPPQLSDRLLQSGILRQQLLGQGFQLTARQA